MAGKKKAKVGVKKTLTDEGKTESTDIEEEVVEEEVAAPKPAIVPEDIVTRRGTSVGGTRKLLRSDYNKEIAAERGEKEDE